eukprot:6478590-Prymnesium_polylepis.1
MDTGDGSTHTNPRDAAGSTQAPNAAVIARALGAITWVRSRGFDHAGSITWVRSRGFDHVGSITWRAAHEGDQRVVVTRRLVTCLGESLEEA